MFYFNFFECKELEVAFIYLQHFTPKIVRFQKHYSDIERQQEIFSNLFSFKWV
ncbi:hypothetical protein FM106_27010 [Brachybacterium faecium]|nr:hypothetical protein FM106_27010 [Brachybacterium faecium]